MTVIRPNSISGVTSITAQGGNINVFRADGTAGDLVVNNINAGVSTFSGNVSIGGTLTYEDVTNIDAIGIVTARAGINLVGNDLNVGSNIKIGNASGIVTATSFVGALTGNVTGTIQTAAQTNITSVGTLSALTVSGNINVTSSDPTIVFVDSNNNPDFDIKAGGGRFAIRDSTNNTERLRITSSGSVGIGTDSPTNNALTLGGTSAALICQNPNSGYGSNQGFYFGNGNGTIGYVWNYENDEIRFATNNTEKLRINTSGQLIFDADTNTHIARPAADTLAVTTNGTERMRITAEGDIYGPVGGRKNWFDNGSFDCTVGGRKANTSMDHGNHHAYGWVTDRFMSRNSVQWSRSTNVPTGKGFSYSTQTNGAAGQIMQAVELPDYGDMGVFTPGSYWCVSIWSTASMSNSAAAFSYDLGSTKTDVTLVDNSTNNYASTGETAAGTSTGTFTRYYKVFQMPSSIISGATGLYFTWGFSAAGYATGWQLERVPTSTSKPTPYEHVHPSVTIARCRRYAYRKYNSRHVCGWKRHDSNVNWEARHPVLPTHMPSGSNQNADPYGVIMHTAGTLTNFQSVWQNPAVTALYRYGFNPSDGSFILYGTSGYSGTHVVIPSYEGFEYEIQHGFF